MRLINSFRGEYRWLSNFELAAVFYNGDVYSTNEHFYQSHKFVKGSDAFEKVRLAKSPGKALRIAHKLIKAKDSLMAHWEDDRVGWMLDGLRLKFSQHWYLRKKLIETDDAILVEGNDHDDKFWGQVNGEGLNMLGHLLMVVRYEVRV